MRDLISFFKSKKFWIHSLSAIIIIVAFYSLTDFMLKWYTDHGKTIEVPDIRGLNTAIAERDLANLQLFVNVNDSIWVDNVKPGVILEQDPLAGNKVKKKRTIYVKVASSVKPKIKMPNLVDLSFRQAQTILETYGLILGKTTYVPDIAQNAVLEMKNKSKMLHPGDLVEKGDVIDLTLGLGMGGTLVEVPYLIGFTVEEAERILEVSMLRAGAIVADETVKDRSKAIIYKQMPDPLKKDLIPAGKVIDLYITLDKSKIQQDETSTED